MPCARKIGLCVPLTALAGPYTAWVRDERYGTREGNCVPCVYCRAAKRLCDCSRSPIRRPRTLPPCAEPPSVRSPPLPPRSTTLPTPSQAPASRRALSPPRPRPPLTPHNKIDRLQMIQKLPSPFNKILFSTVPSWPAELITTAIMELRSKTGW